MVAAASLQAGTITTTCGFSLESDYDHAFSTTTCGLSQFDPSLGTLASAQWSIPDGSWSLSGYADPIFPTFLNRATLRMDFSLNGGGKIVLSQTHSTGLLDVFGMTPFADSGPAAATGLTITDPAALSAYLGTGPLTPTLSLSVTHISSDGVFVYWDRVPGTGRCP